MENAGKKIRRANPSTIQDKFLVGYQGWFACPGDGEKVTEHGWLHWFDRPIQDGGRPHTDLWPDVSEYSPSELFAAPGLKFSSGEQAFLFSSRHPKTVRRHMNWMARHGVDGVFLQRFAGQCDVMDGSNEGIRRIRDEVGERVREAAEQEGRVFAIMYDVSGVDPDRIQAILENDWIHLIRQGVLDSPSYLREKGRPVIAIWGFGFSNSHHSPQVVSNITKFFRDSTPGGAYIKGGAPAFWRTSNGDADPDPGFLDVWLNDFDAISPWTVGRYNSNEETDSFAETNIKGDVELLKTRSEEGHKKIDYIPVVLPGGSAFNMSDKQWEFNGIKRRGGRFLWRQIFNVKQAGVRIIYGAMWDEYDEGTAFMPVVEKTRNLPESEDFPFLALDADGYEVPSDWYMRICGFAAEGLRSERIIHETFPSKELQDYWSTRPKYEDTSAASSSSSSSSSDTRVVLEEVVKPEIVVNADYQAWLATQKDDKDEPPPPPYSLEADEESSSGPVNRQSSSSLAQTPRPAPVQVTSSSSSRLSGPLPSPLSPSRTPQSPVAALTSDFARHGMSSSSSSPQPGDIVSVNYVTLQGRHSNPSSPPLQMRPSSHQGPPLPSRSSGRSSSQGPSMYRPGPSPPSHPSQVSYFPQQQQSGPSSISPPPLHPAHPAAGAPRPNFQSRPVQRPATAAGHSNQPYASSSTPVSPLPISDNRQWPPSDWNVNRPELQQSSSYNPSYQQRPPPSPGAQWSNSGGAQLTRPHTFAASSARPPPANQFRPMTTFEPQGPPAPFPVARVEYPDAGPLMQGNPSFAAPYGPPRASTSNLDNSYYCPGVNDAPYITPSQSPPRRPYDAPMPHFPQGPYDPGFPGGYQQEYRPQEPMFPQNGGRYNDSSPYPAGPSIPNPHTGPSFPGPQFVNQSSTPPMGSRPPAVGQYASYAGPPNSYPYNNNIPSSSSSAGPLGFAFTAVDKVAGRKTRDQLETGVDTLAQTGNKLLGKFMR
ncbi:hypothetical protein C8J56DRAFT_917665 [Mycena floridula]|nr:hypothetical protein C8J56DRAFT_917665 [Mycena floridula]